MIEVGKCYRTPDGHTYETLRSEPFNSSRWWWVELDDGTVHDWPECVMTEDPEVSDGE